MIHFLVINKTNSENAASLRVLSRHQAKKNLDELTSDFSLTFPKELYSEKVRLR